MRLDTLATVTISAGLTIELIAVTTMIWWSRGIEWHVFTAMFCGFILAVFGGLLCILLLMNAGPRRGR